MDFHDQYVEYKRLERKSMCKDTIILLVTFVCIGSIWIASYGFTGFFSKENRTVNESTSLNLSEQDRGRVYTCRNDYPQKKNKRIARPDFGQ